MADLSMPYEIGPASHQLKMGNWCRFLDTATQQERSGEIVHIDAMTDSVYINDPLAEVGGALALEGAMPGYSGKPGPIVSYTHRCFESNVRWHGERVVGPAGPGIQDTLKWLDQ